MAIAGIGLNLDAYQLNGDLALCDRELSYFHKVGCEYVEVPVHGVD